MKRLIKITILTFAIWAAPHFVTSAIAQPPPPPPQDIPLDGGLISLLAAGIAYGGRKLYKAKQQ